MANWRANLETVHILPMLTGLLGFQPQQVGTLVDAINPVQIHFLEASRQEEGMCSVRLGPIKWAFLRDPRAADK